MKTRKIKKGENKNTANEVTETIVLPVTFPKDKYQRFVKAEYNGLLRIHKRLKKAVERLREKGERGEFVKEDLRTKEKDCVQVEKIMVCMLKKLGTGTYTEKEAKNGFLDCTTSKLIGPMSWQGVFGWHDLSKAYSKHHSIKGMPCKTCLLCY